MDTLSSEFLYGWKAIGAHIGRSGRTARRWAAEKSLPILRGLNGRPFALRSELTVFLMMYSSAIEKECGEEIREQQRTHAAMMRKRKKDKQTLAILREGAWSGWKTKSASKPDHANINQMNRKDAR
jgi:hypothetical protein